MTRGDAGQSAVETLGLLPVVVAVSLGVAQLLAAGAARSAASGAAEAGATAVLQQTASPETAAHRAAPAWARGRMAVAVEGRVVRVRIRPRAFLPLVAGALTATATVDAGPAR